MVNLLLTSEIFKAIQIAILKWLSVDFSLFLCFVFFNNFNVLGYAYVLTDSVELLIFKCYASGTCERPSVSPKKDFGNPKIVSWKLN